MDGFELTRWSLLNVDYGIMGDCYASGGAASTTHSGQFALPGTTKKSQGEHFPAVLFYRAEKEKILDIAKSNGKHQVFILSINN